MASEVGKKGALVGLSLVTAMAVVVALLDIFGSNKAQRAPGRTTASAPSTSSSTLPGYPLDAAAGRPVVPWVDSPPPGVPTPPGEVVPCEASQLRVVRLGGEGATGHAADSVEVSNATARPCSIDGRPVVELRDGRGRLVARSGERVPFICSGCGTNATPGPLLRKRRRAIVRPTLGPAMSDSR
jgi:hypothetical protein